MAKRTTPAPKKNAAKAAKALQQYEQTEPMQLSFFAILAPEDRHLSNTIELYDFMPKYHWGKPERVQGKFLNSLERSFECRGAKYKLRVDPAKIEDEDGVIRDFYPSKREELVEDALRKLASSGQGVFLDDHAGVTFSLYQLQKELKRNGHSYSKEEIKDALLICAQSNLTVTTEDGKSLIVSSLFETLGLTTREDWQGQGEKSRAFVRFNPLVTASIKNASFRLFNYESSMTYKSVIARQLHKRMAHHFTQASLSNPYHINLSTIIRDFGLTVYDKLPNNLREVEKALKEMQEKEVVLSYIVQKTLDTAQRGKLVDATIHITPHPKFTQEVMHANHKQKSHRELSAFVAQRPEKRH